MVDGQHLDSGEKNRAVVFEGATDVKLYQIFGKLYGKPFTAGFVTKTWEDGRETVTGSAPILRKRLRHESIEYVRGHCRENSWILREVQ